MIVANAYIQGDTSTGDWDVIVNVQNPETDPIFFNSPAFGITSL
jgi:hypothetical protein